MFTGSSYKVFFFLIYPIALVLRVALALNKETVMPDYDSAHKRSWPFPAGAMHRIVPEKRNTDAPATQAEYSAGDRSIKAGTKHEQPDALKSTS